MVNPNTSRVDDIDDVLAEFDKYSGLWVAQLAAAARAGAGGLLP